MDATVRWQGFAEEAYLSPADLLVYALLLIFGALHVYFAARAPDFPGDNVFWIDSGRSLVEHGFYGINGYSETNMPPGLPALLGVMGTVWGYQPVIFFRAMAVFGTLALLVSYELLKRSLSRSIAAAICLLLITSVTHFKLVTQEVWPCYLYALTTIGALLIATKLENASTLTSRMIWAASLTALVLISLSLASAAIALLGAIALRIIVILLRNRPRALVCAGLYIPVFLIGISSQGLWMENERFPASAGISAKEWPLPGFPRSYLSQLKVKNGNDPELGFATPRDVAVRILENARVESDLLSRTVMRELPQLDWTSIFVLVPILLVTVGWATAVKQTGGELKEWYFAAYEAMYLLWPWFWESRFFLPIAPLACLYLWLGGKAFIQFLRDKPRLVALVSLPLTIILTICAARSVHGPPAGNKSIYLEFQDELSFVVWLLSALLSAWIVWTGNQWLRPATATMVSFQRLVRAGRMNPADIGQGIGMGSVIGLIFLGLAMQLPIGRDNLDLSSSVNHSADADAGAWVRSHTAPDAVLMARQVPTVWHYSGRKVVWFPPSSNPQLLMKGIKQDKIDFVIVVRRESSYYLPPDDACFAALRQAFPTSFQLIHKDAEFQVFEVDKHPRYRKEWNVVIHSAVGS